MMSIGTGNNGCEGDLTQSHSFERRTSMHHCYFVDGMVEEAVAWSIWANVTSKSVFEKISVRRGIKFSLPGRVFTIRNRYPGM